MLKALIFDFNGVLVESTDNNAMIYAKIFSPYGEETVKKVVEHYKQFGGIPRQKRIEMYLRDFAKVQPTDRLVKQLSEQFSELYLQSLKHAQLVPGVKEFFQNHGKRYKNFVSSGAPQDEIPLMLEILGLKQYFIGFYGAPRAKDQHIAEILNSYSLEPKQVVFIGDSPKDKQAAQKNNVWFIARLRGVRALENEQFKIRDLFDLPQVLEQIESVMQSSKK